MYSNFHGEVQNGMSVDYVLRSYFPDYNYKGVFIDIGAFEPIRISNSYHFEKNGWTVYCIEANTNLIPSLQEHRQNVIHTAVGSMDMLETDFTIVEANGWTAGFSALKVSETYKQIFGFNPTNIQQIKVPLKTMKTILNDLNITNIDIVSLDIEGSELDCLYGFDLAHIKPKVFVIENVDNNPQIESYLNSFGYKLDKQYSYNQYYCHESHLI